jgi:hypothetical protein
MKNHVSVCLISLSMAMAGQAQTPAPAAEPPPARRVIPANTGKKDVPPEVMRRINEETKVPFKYGVVVKGGNGHSADCPNVFRQGGLWYMVHNEFDGAGYSTHLASSPDLLTWTPLGTILKQHNQGWDAEQACGSVALVDYTWGGSYAYQPFDGKYWMPYIGGDKKGRETPPLSIGMAWSTDPTKAKEWERLPEPVLSIKQPDVRKFESRTLFKSNVIWDKEKSLGHPFVMFYNAGEKGKPIERIGMAVSDDMTHWTRYGQEPVIDNFKGISGDPQITRIGDVWVMFYFGAGWKPKAFDTFACSYDLVHWTKWEGDPQVTPTESWEGGRVAHKPWVVKHNGVVYHFYGTGNGPNRCIALATSKDLKIETEKEKIP